MNELLMQLLSQAGNTIIILPQDQLTEEEEGSDLFKALSDKKKMEPINPVPSPS